MGAPWPSSVLHGRSASCGVCIVAGGLHMSGEVLAAVAGGNEGEPRFVRDRHGRTQEISLIVNDTNKQSHVKAAA